MSGGEALFAVLTLATIAAVMYLIFSVIPRGIADHYNGDIVDLRDRLWEIDRRQPGTLKREDVARLDYVMDRAVAREDSLKLSGTLTILTLSVITRRRRTASVRRAVQDYKGMHLETQMELKAIDHSLLKALLLRGFLGSALWPVSWVGAVWVLTRLRGRGAHRRAAMQVAVLEDLVMPTLDATVTIHGTRMPRRVPAV